MHIGAKTMIASASPHVRYWAQIAGFAFVATGFCVATRVIIVLRQTEELNSFGAVKQVLKLALAYSVYDLITIALCTLSVFILCLVLGPKGRYIAIRALATFLGFICITAFINIETSYIYESPLTYSLICYSDFFKSAAGKNFIIGWVPTYMLVGLPLSTAAFFIIGFQMAHLIDNRRKSGSLVRVLLITGSAIIGILAFRERSVYADDLNPEASENAAVALIRSFAQSPQLVLSAPDDPANINADETSSSGTADVKIVRPMDGKVRNVLIYIMESVGAKYVDLYGGPEGTTPVLKGLASKGVTFNNAYATTPSSEGALVSLFTSRNPFISFHLATENALIGSWPSISTELHRRGYKTALFHSADTRYGGEDKFLARQNLDVVNDAQVLHCGRDTLFDDADKIQAVDDRCTTSALIDWIKKNKNESLFGVLWTFETHYPYYAIGPQHAFQLPPTPNWATAGMNRYLNGIRHADELLGKIVEVLNEENLADSTLLVILGDHGEGFYQHNHGGHGADIYEESIKIPLVFYNPKLFDGQRSLRLTSQKDIPPTIFWLLGIDPKPQWEGKNLFTDGGLDEEYFFSAWRGYSVGYVRDRRKYIWNVNSDRLAIYDLASDPEERVNLAEKLPSEASRARRKLANWVRSRNATSAVSATAN
jgi:lipoteichoic acid synthase